MVPKGDKIYKRQFGGGYDVLQGCKPLQNIECLIAQGGGDTSWEA